MRIKERAVRLESSHRNDSVIEYTGSQVSEHLLYKTLFSTLSFCIWTKQDQKRKVNVLYDSLGEGAYEWQTCFILQIAQVEPHRHGASTYCYCPQNTENFRSVSILQILFTQPIALENPTISMISIVKEEDFGTLVIPGMYLDRENTFCL